VIEKTAEDFKDLNIKGTIFGHIGDGNFHTQILYDKNDPISVENAEKANLRGSLRAIENGGTCTGEHGIGIGKVSTHNLAKYIKESVYFKLGVLEKQFGPGGMRVMRAVKQALDPKGIMNPGKVLKM